MFTLILIALLTMVILGFIKYLLMLGGFVFELIFIFPIKLLLGKDVSKYASPERKIYNLLRSKMR